MLVSLGGPLVGEYADKAAPNVQSEEFGSKDEEEEAGLRRRTTTTSSLRGVQQEFEVKEGGQKEMSIKR